jgi:hypothetical protein
MATFRDHEVGKICRICETYDTTKNLNWWEKNMKWERREGGISFKEFEGLLTRRPIGG